MIDKLNRSHLTRTLRLRLLLLNVFFGLAVGVFAQMPILQNLSTVDGPPEKLLAVRSAVIHASDFTDDELTEIQKWFQQTGIDAIAYFDYDHIFAGPDFTKLFSDYCATRIIPFLIFLEKNRQGYEFTFAKSNGKKDLIDRQEAVWKVSNADLKLLLRTIYQTALSSQKKQNFLINDVPERDVVLRNFAGRRNESFTNEVRTNKIAIPRWGNTADDALLESYLRSTLSVKFELVDPTIEDKDLRQAGFVTVLRYVRTHGSIAKELLGYDLSQVSKAINSFVWMNGEQQIKTLPAEEIIYKFYFKSLEYNQVYLGIQWDADVQWQDALRNHIEAMKKTLRLN